MITLTDGVIKLAPMTLADVEAVVSGDDPEQIRWLSGGPTTTEGARQWIRKNAEYWKNGGPVFNFGIYDAKDGQLMGMVEANTDYALMAGVEEGEANLSYLLYPKARGRGFATRAVKLVLRFLAGKEVTAAVIRTHQDNLRSQEIARRCDFEPAGEVVSDEITGRAVLKVFRHPLAHHLDAPTDGP